MFLAKKFAYHIHIAEKVDDLVSVADPESCVFLTPGSGMGKKSGSVSGMNNPDHISENLETIFWVKILKFFDADPDGQKFGSWMEKFGSGINIPDRQHWYRQTVPKETTVSVMVHGVCYTYSCLPIG